MTDAVVLSGIGKSFAGISVLRDISFSIREGEVHALLGENGAGKSTLIKIIGGMHAPDTGSLTIAGKTERLASPRDAADRGVAVVHQELLLFEELSVAENIFLGHAPRVAWGGIDWPRMRRDARALLDSLDSHGVDVDARVGSLSVANRQRVEIARALSRNASVLVLDEPTAALADADARRLLVVLRRLRERGVAIVYVSHRLNEVFALADRVTILRDGGLVATLAIGELDETRLVGMMVGRSVEQLFPKVAAAIGETRLALEGVCHGDVVHDISLSVRAGEIVGIAGLIGAGRTELALTIFGITPATAGTIHVAGKPVRIASPRDASAHGIAYVPEDRGRQGLVRTQSIGENVSLAVLSRIARAGFISAARERERGGEAIAKLGIRARGADQPVRQLSGGNQQKVVIGKWLATEPRILIMDEPTRGIDVGAKSEIHALMGRLARQGLAILMISSELPEVLGMSDRVLVMRGGRIVAAFDRADASPDAVGAAMTGAVRDAA